MLWEIEPVVWMKATCVPSGALALLNALPLLARPLRVLKVPWPAAGLDWTAPGAGAGTSKLLLGPGPAGAASLSVPPATAVVPVWALELLDRIRVPGPFFSREPVPVVE